MGLGILADWYIGKLVDWKTGRLGKMKEKQWRSIIDERELEIKIRDPGIEMEELDEKKMRRNPLNHFMRREDNNELVFTHTFFPRF